jgi:Fatty acid desaturase
MQREGGGELDSGSSGGAGTAPPDSAKPFPTPQPACDTSLKESRCIFCTANLYLTLPLVSLLAFLLVRFASLRPSLTEQPLETIGALWLTGYLFALAGATVAHELTHRSNRLAKLSAYLLLGFTGNASFVIYHIYTHHRQVGRYDDAATARRGERLRTFMARTLTQQFAHAARLEAARLKRRGLSPILGETN